MRTKYSHNQLECLTPFRTIYFSRTICILQVWNQRVVACSCARENVRICRNAYRCAHTEHSMIPTPARVCRALKVEHASSCSDVTRDATPFFIYLTDCFLSRFSKLLNCVQLKVRYVTFSGIFSKSC